jgi:STE24 endopeptidase
MTTASLPENTERAKQYKRAKIAFFVGGILFSWISAAFFLLTGASRKVTDASSKSVRNEHAGNSVAVTVFMMLSWIVSFPLAYLRGHRLEQKYEMSNQSFSGWLGDELKSLAIQLVLMVPLSQVMLGVIRRRPNDWWAVLSAMSIPFTVILVHLAPVLIMPLFNTYQPLRDQRLADRLKTLAERSGVKVADIMEMDMSRQSKAGTAFFTGLGSTKRIVLADTLLNELTHDEIEAVVAHEMAHQINRDIWRLLSFGILTNAATTWFTQRAFNVINAKSTHRTGVRGAGYVEALPLLAIVTSVVGMILMPLQNAHSRYIERKADRYAMELTGNPGALKSGLNRLSELNLADPDPSRLEQILLHGHPSITERGRACDEYARQLHSTTNQ